MNGWFLLMVDLWGKNLYTIHGPVMVSHQKTSSHHGSMGLVAFSYMESWAKICQGSYVIGQMLGWDGNIYSQSPSCFRPEYGGEINHTWSIWVGTPSAPLLVICVGSSLSLLGLYQSLSSIIYWGLVSQQSCSFPSLAGCCWESSP